MDDIPLPASHGRPRPTMADVARRAGVSKMTVSRALAGQSVAAPTRDRVLAVVAELGYVPDASAGALSSGRSGFVATLVPTLNNANFADTARGLTEALAPAGLQLLLGFTDYRPEREEELVRAMLARRPEAMVLTGGSHSPVTRAMLRQAKLPVLETWEQPPEPIGCAIGFSNADAAMLMVRHLAERGYRRIAFLGGEPGLDRRGAARERGYVEALARLGLGPPRIVHHGIPPLSLQHGAEAVVRLMEDFPDSDAAFCVSDLSAFGAIMACRRRGWAVPQRLAVAGFGDFEIARVCCPSITTIGVDAHALGLRAGAVLLDALAAGRAGRPWPAVAHIPFPVAVIGRESS